MLIIFVFGFGIVAILVTRLYQAFSPSGDTSVSPRTIPDSVLPHSPNTHISSKSKTGKKTLLLHPLADPEKRETYENKPINSWDEWVNARTEIHLGSHVEKGFILTPHEVISNREIFVQHFMMQALRYKKKNHPVPQTAIDLPYLKEQRYYQGPQTVEAIMAEYDDGYENIFPRAAEMEETYPRESFLQRALDKGAVIKDASDYVYWMKLRNMLLYRKDRPKDWQSGSYGIPVTTDFAEYEEGFLERKVWENNITQQVSETNPGQSVHVYFPASHPDVYLPQIGKMTYVHRDKYGGIDAFGASLTKEQRINLLRRGIEPDDREIVYIDEDYNVLSDPPPVVTLHDLISRSQSPLPADDRVQLTPDRPKSDGEKPDLQNWPTEFETWQKNEPPDTDDPNAARRKAAREAAAREVAKMEFERFQDSMRQRKEFETMADKEVSRELAKQFSKQFLSKHSLKQGNSKQLENALELMFQHGFEEGFRRVRHDSPSIADQLERYLAETQRPPEPQKKPQRPTPPTPSETPPSQPDAP